MTTVLGSIFDVPTVIDTHRVCRTATDNSDDRFGLFLPERGRGLVVKT